MQHSKLRTSVFLFVVSACVASSSSALAQSLWDHNGSQMRLEAQGNNRKFIYETPRQGEVVGRLMAVFQEAKAIRQLEENTRVIREVEGMVSDRIGRFEKECEDRLREGLKREEEERIKKWELGCK